MALDGPVRNKTVQLLFGPFTAPVSLRGDDVTAAAAVNVQVVTCVPTSILPKRCRQVGQETDEMLGDGADVDDDVMDEMGERGHILWIRGLSRLQHQVRVNKKKISHQ